MPNVAEDDVAVSSVIGIIPGVGRTHDRMRGNLGVLTGRGKAGARGSDERRRRGEIVWIAADWDVVAV